MTAGLQTLKLLEDGSLLNQLNKEGEKIRKNLRNIFETQNINVHISGISSIFQTHFTNKKVKNASAVFQSDREKLLNYHMNLINNGIFFSPTKIGVLSTEHTKENINKFLAETENYVKMSKEYLRT